MWGFSPQGGASATGAVHPELKREVDALCGSPISEEFLEGIHAGVHRLQVRSTAALLPWASASQTLEENLSLYEQVGSQLAGWIWDIRFTKWLVDVSIVHLLSAARFKFKTQSSLGERIGLSA